MKGDLKKKYSKIFKQKFSGNTATTNIVDVSAEVLNSENTNFFNRKEKTFTKRS